MRQRLAGLGRQRGHRPAAALLGLLLLALSGAAGAQETFKPLMQGETPPDFVLPDTAGKQVRLGELQGRVILLSFVSCYTDTCLSALANFEPLSLKLGPSRLALVSVCVEVPAALKENRYAGLRERCGAGQTLLQDETRVTSRVYHVSEFPTSFLIAPDFTVREVVTGAAALRAPDLRERIEALAAQVPLPPAAR